MNISVQGAPIYFTIPIFGGIPISATLVITWLIMAIVTGLCLWLTHDMKVSNVSKRQAVAEFLGLPLELHQPSLEAMGRYFRGIGRTMTATVNYSW